MPSKKEMNLQPQLLANWNKIETPNGFTLFEHIQDDLKVKARAFASRADVHYLITTDRFLHVFLTSVHPGDWPQEKIEGMTDRRIVDLDFRFGETEMALLSNGTTNYFTYERPKAKVNVFSASGLIATSANSYNRLVLNRSGSVTAFPVIDENVNKNKARLDLSSIKAIACGNLWSLAIDSDCRVFRWYKSALIGENHITPVQAGSGKFKQLATGGNLDILLLSNEGEVFGFSNTDKEGKIWQLVLPEPTDYVTATGSDLYAARGLESGEYYVWGDYKGKNDANDEKMAKKFISAEENNKNKKKAQKSSSVVTFLKTQLTSLPEVIVKYSIRQDTPHLMWIAQPEDEEEKVTEEVRAAPKKGKVTHGIDKKMDKVMAVLTCGRSMRIKKNADEEIAKPGPDELAVSNESKEQQPVIVRRGMKQKALKDEVEAGESGPSPDKIPKLSSEVEDNDQDPFVFKTDEAGPSKMTWSKKPKTAHVETSNIVVRRAGRSGSGKQNEKTEKSEEKELEQTSKAKKETKKMTKKTSPNMIEAKKVKEMKPAVVVEPSAKAKNQMRKVTKKISPKFTKEMTFQITDETGPSTPNSETGPSISISNAGPSTSITEAVPSTLTNKAPEEQQSQAKRSGRGKTGNIADERVIEAGNGKPVVARKLRTRL